MIELLKKTKDVISSLAASYAFLSWLVLSVIGFVQIHRADAGISPNAQSNDFVIGVIKTDIAQVCVQGADYPPESITFFTPMSVKILVVPYKLDPSKKIILIKK